MSTKNMIKFCPYCGLEIIPNARFCINCGNELKNLFDNIENHSDDTDKTSYNKENTEEYENLKEENTIMESNNEKFDLIRPNGNNNPVNYNNQQIISQNDNNIFISELACPMCQKQMNKSTTSGFLSSSTHHICNDCQLTFKEEYNALKLEKEPEFTRIHSRLHLKKYSYNEWKDLFAGRYISEIFDNVSNWTYDSATTINCPACNHTFNRYSQGFGNHYLICSGCLLILKEHKGKYSLYDSVENYSPLWRYENKKLTLYEISNIFINEDNDKTRQFRQMIVKESELKKQEEENKRKMEENDLAIFHNSLESGNPLLPVPDDTVIVLKKNEIPIYRINNVRLSEPRAVRTSHGQYGGTSVRVMKGVTIHSGQSTTKSQSHDEIKLIDSGKLLITNKRIVFLGNNRTTNIDLNKIIAINSKENTIQIQRSNKQKPEYFDNIKTTEKIMINERQYNITMDGEMLKKLIVGLI